MTPQEREAEIRWTKQVQAMARHVLHDPGNSPDIRQTGRDMAVLTHTELTLLEDGKG